LALALAPRGYGVAVWSNLLWSTLSWLSPEAQEAHGSGPDLYAESVGSKAKSEIASGAVDV